MTNWWASEERRKRELGIRDEPPEIPFWGLLLALPLFVIAAIGLGAGALAGSLLGRD